MEDMWLSSCSFLEHLLWGNSHHTVRILKQPMEEELRSLINKIQCMNHLEVDAPAAVYHSD
jgi:hypothetical protein